MSGRRSLLAMTTPASFRAVHRAIPPQVVRGGSEPGSRWIGFVGFQGQGGSRGAGGRSGLAISDFVENEAVIAGDFGRRRAKIPLTFPPPSVDWCRLVERFDVPTVHYSQQNQHVFRLTTALTAQASCTKQTHVDAVFVTQNRDRRVLRPPILSYHQILIRFTCRNY